jgi:hypothetical protein
MGPPIALEAEGMAKGPTPAASTTAQCPVLQGVGRKGVMPEVIC